MSIDGSPGVSGKNCDIQQTVDSDTNNSETSERDKVMGWLDKLQVHVEYFRNFALRLEEDKEMVLTMLDELRNSEKVADLNALEKEEVLEYADQVASRYHTVNIGVKTMRDSMQEESLYQVNSYIDALVITLHDDSAGTRTRCLTYMNACSSHSHTTTDKNFESALLGCTLDDQKRVKKRLQGLLDYIDNVIPI